jgi:hypothetical protein
MEKSKLRLFWFFVAKNLFFEGISKMNIVKELSAKVDELDRRIKQNGTNSMLGVSQNNFLMGEFIQGSREYSLGNITATTSGQSVLQVLVKLRASEQSSVNLKLRAGGMTLYDGDRALNIGDNEIFIMASLILAEGESVDVVLEICPIAELTNYISSATCYIWSNSLSAMTVDKTIINADGDENSLCVTIVVDRKIYNYHINNAKSLNFQDFTYYADGILSDCVLLNDVNGEVQSVWFRLAGDNTLYMSKTGSVQDEEVIESGVSHFSVSAINSRSGILVCFIKNDMPYYLTIEDGKLSNSVAFNVSMAKKYKSVCALKSQSSYVYVVISSENGANLLFDVAPEIKLGSKSTGDCIKLYTTMQFL